MSCIPLLIHANWFTLPLSKITRLVIRKRCWNEKWKVPFLHLSTCNWRSCRHVCLCLTLREFSENTRYENFSFMFQTVSWQVMPGEPALWELRHMGTIVLQKKILNKSIGYKLIWKLFWFYYSASPNFSTFYICRCSQTSKYLHSNKYPLIGYLFCVVVSRTLFMYYERYSVVFELLLLLNFMSKYVSIRHSLFWNNNSVDWLQGVCSEKTNSMKWSTSVQNIECQNLNFHEGEMVF